MFRALGILLSGCAGVLAQTPPQNGPDTATPAPIFQSKVSLVLAPVVVRDAQERAIGTLNKEDFQLFDKGKRQTIVSFSVVKRDVVKSDVVKSDIDTPADKSSGAAGGPANAEAGRFLIYLFDDLNTSFSDLAAIREAAARHFKNGLHPSDRAAIYSFSGRSSLDFTADPDKLASTAGLLRVQPALGHDGLQCPAIDYYIADMIVNRADPQALRALEQQISDCSHISVTAAAKIAEPAARQALSIGEQDTRISLGIIRRAIRRLAGMPGQRLIVLASPGFFVQTSDATDAMTEILNFAARANVTISALDPRGVYLMSPDSSQASRGTLWLQYRNTSARVTADVLAEFAEGTGGTFFHSNNDLKDGFQRTTAVPEFSYLLGFPPASGKPDGSFHPIKVRLTNGKGMSIEARRGYYAIQQAPGEQAAKADIEDAVFSRDEIRGVPVTLQLAYSKPNAGAPKLLVVPRVALKSLHFKKVNDRSLDTLTVVSALFDSDGGYVMGATKTADLKLSDHTLAEVDPGVTLRMDFEVKPGTYRVRVVVREAEGKEMTTLNRMVTVP